MVTYLGRSQAFPSMKSESDWDNAKELQSIEVKINKNGNKHEESYSKWENIAFF